MSDHDRDDRTPEDETLGPMLRAMRDALSPPPSLERRTLDALRARNLLTPEGPRTRRGLPAAAALAAGIALFAAGLMTGRILASRPPAGGAAGVTSEYLLLLREPASFAAGAAEREDPRELVREYGDWARAGEAVRGGERLEDRGRLLRLAGGRLEASPLAPGTDADPIGGYFVIRAAGDDEAIQIAGTCPHLKYGGRIELRPIAD